MMITLMLAAMMVGVVMLTDPDSEDDDDEDDAEDSHVQTIRAALSIVILGVEICRILPAVQVKHARSVCTQSCFIQPYTKARNPIPA